MPSTWTRALPAGLLLLSLAAATTACGDDSVDPSNPDASNAKETSGTDGASVADGGATAEGGGEAGTSD